MGLKSAICGIVAFIAWVLQQCGIDFGADAQAHFSDAILNIVQGVGMIAVIGGGANGKTVKKDCSFSAWGWPA